MTMRNLNISEMEFVAGGFDLDVGNSVWELRKPYKSPSGPPQKENPLDEWDSEWGNYLAGGRDMDGDGDVDITDGYLLMQQRDEFMYQDRLSTPGRSVLGAISALVDAIQGDTPDINNFEPRPMNPGS